MIWPVSLISYFSFSAVGTALKVVRVGSDATGSGRVKSVAVIPSISTHQQQGEAGRATAQIPPGLVRLSIGGEHPAAVIDDLEQALAG